MRCRGLLLATLFVAGACDPGTTSTVTPSPEPNQTITPAQRASSRMVLRVENHAVGRDRPLIAAAVRNLKKLGMWKKLTKDTYVVYIATRRGVQHVPSDGHLADAVPTVLIDERGSGPVCDIRFYSTAMARELEVRRQMYEYGEITRPPPTERVFWTAVLAHELAHCIGDAGRGEKIARRWERRALRGAERLQT